MSTVQEIQNTHNHGRKTRIVDETCIAISLIAFNGKLSSVGTRSPVSRRLACMERFETMR
jgi:hypothetical protein